MDAKVLQRPSRSMGDTVCIELQRKPLSSVEIGVKRLVDIVGASIGLIALLPLLIITAIAIKLDSRGPILFRQRRCGFNGGEFYILKFRTMSVLEDGELVRQATAVDCRVTRVGRWLRRASIDELPQLWNALTGSMSLVGPRPHAVAHDNEFYKMVRLYAVRHHVKPGLTGWAQVHGCRGPTPTAGDVRRRVEFDLWYIDNWSFRLDCWILLRTVLEVLRSHNAY
jgi:putative colanic acid biosynthesis UDP-glucose lipid carrier transferase